LGDVVPLAQSEQLFTIFLELAGVTIISYMTSTITGLIGSFDARARRRQDKFEEIERFMGAKALSPLLRGTIRDYFELVLASKSTAALDEAKLLAELSGPLQTAVMFEVHSSLIDRFSFFKGKQPEFVRDMLMSANPMVVKHDRVLMREGMTGDSLLLLIEGRVNFESSQGTVYMQLPPGSVFGAMSLLCTGRNVCNARSVGTVQTYTVPRRDMERILEDYPDVERELLALALARLRRLQVERRKTRSQRLAAGVAVFSPEAEAATDAAVTRGLATKPGTGGADGATVAGRGFSGGAGRRASAPVLTAEDLASGRAAGSAERIALLRHMADTKQFRRLSSSGNHLKRGEPESLSRADDDSVGSPSRRDPRSSPGTLLGRVDSKAAAAEAEDSGIEGAEGASSPSASVTAAVRDAAAARVANSSSATSQSMHQLTGPGRAVADVTEQPLDVVGRPRGTHTSGFMKAAGLTAGGGPIFAGTPASRSAASAHRGAEEEEEGGPQGTAPRLLDAESRQESLTGKSRSGVALRDSASFDKPRGSRRHSLASADPFDRQLMSSKEQELREQTDSLIERTLTTAKRAVRRKERLVTRMAAERERRQFTSRPMDRTLQSSSPHPDEPSGRQRQLAKLNDVPPPTLVAAGRSQSKTLQKRARGLRAKLDEQRRALRAMASIGTTSTAVQSAEEASNAGMGLTPPAATPASMDVSDATSPGLPPSTVVSAAAATAVMRGSSRHMVVQPPDAPGSPGSSAHTGGDLDGLRLVTTSSNLLLSPDPRSAHGRPRGTDPATAFALDEMTAAMRGVASALMGLQQEQEAIVDLLIAVLADDEVEEDAL
jgi:CRP-like cAMP-binding protein